MFLFSAKPLGRSADCDQLNPFQKNSKAFFSKNKNGLNQ
jgi:hypothetical protein